jgi:hypothetical protein
MVECYNLAHISVLHWSRDIDPRVEPRRLRTRGEANFNAAWLDLDDVGAMNGACRFCETAGVRYRIHSDRIADATLD